MFHSCFPLLSRVADLQFSQTFFLHPWNQNWNKFCATLGHFSDPCFIVIIINTYSWIPGFANTAGFPRQLRLANLRVFFYWSTVHWTILQCMFKVSAFWIDASTQTLAEAVIDFLIASCGSSSHIIRSAVFSSRMFFGCGFRRLNLSSIQPKTW